MGSYLSEIATKTIKKSKVFAFPVCEVVYFLGRVGGFSSSVALGFYLLNHAGILKLGAQTLKSGKETIFRTPLLIN